MRADLLDQLGTDSIVAFLKSSGLPVTRENYLGMAYPDGLPDDYGAELEANLPPELQDFDELECEPAIPPSGLSDG